MKADTQTGFWRNRGDWEDRWIRFRMVLKRDGVEPKFHEFYRNWVVGFVKFIRPRKFEEARSEDIEEYIKHLAANGKAQWQLRQMEEALQIMFQEIDPREWAKDWSIAVKAPMALEDGRAAVVSGGPVGDPDRFRGRGDSGEISERYEVFLKQVQEKLRLERYAYRTEQAYLDWVKRYLIFANPPSREAIGWADAQEYFEYLTLVRRLPYQPIHPNG